VSSVFVYYGNGFSDSIVSLLSGEVGGMCGWGNAR